MGDLSTILGLWAASIKGVWINALASQITGKLTLFNSLFRITTKKTSSSALLAIVRGTTSYWWIPSQSVSYVENVSMSWHHHKSVHWAYSSYKKGCSVKTWCLSWPNMTLAGEIICPIIHMVSLLWCWQWATSVLIIVILNIYIYMSNIVLSVGYFSVDDGNYDIYEALIGLYNGLYIFMSVTDVAQGRIYITCFQVTMYCVTCCHNGFMINCGISSIMYCTFRADSRFASSQWETALLCNDVSHWLDASLESALHISSSGSSTVIYSDHHLITYYEVLQWHNIDSFVQDCNISCALIMEILQSCTKP